MGAAAAIAGDQCRLVLRVDAYEFPDSNDVDDANWLNGDVELEAGSTGRFTARHKVSLRADELKQFRDELRVVVETLSGSARLRHLEEQVGCTVELDKGTGAMTAFISEHVGSGLRVKDCKTDQSYLTQAVRELDAVVEQFPPR